MDSNTKILISHVKEVYQLWFKTPKLKYDGLGVDDHSIRITTMGDKKESTIVNFEIDFFPNSQPDIQQFILDVCAALQKKSDDIENIIKKKDIVSVKQSKIIDLRN